MDDRRKQNLFVPLKPEKLLYAKQFYPLDGQIMFWYEEWQEYVVTVIDDTKTYHADEYFLLPENAPYQLINGKLIFMPSPFDIHQKVLSKLHLLLGWYIENNRLGEIRFAPDDVILDEDNVVQPDLLFVSIKRNNIIKSRIFGAPDFVIEILSTGGTQKTDRELKKQLYGKHGVIEYWIVHPTEEYVQVHHNENQQMKMVQTAHKGDTIVSKAIEGLKINVDKIFA